MRVEEIGGEGPSGRDVRFLGPTETTGDSIDADGLFIQERVTSHESPESGNWAGDSIFIENVQKRFEGVEGVTKIWYVHDANHPKR
jgi:hypothetical protein